MSLQKTLEDIKKLKIQGAENIAKQSLNALKEVAHSCKKSNEKEFLGDIRRAANQLVLTRPTEPYLRNNIKYCLGGITEKHTGNIKELLIKNINFRLKSMELDSKRIAEIGSNKIVNGCVVYTHCSSSTVVSILKKAKHQKKRFVVHNTETRPMFQGRKTAEELARAGIKVFHYVDSAARIALKKADMMMIGCDAITSECKIINKIGSEMMAEIASRHNVPVYVCTNSLKFDPKTIKGFFEKIEERSPDEVWKKRPKGVVVENPAFEAIGPELITGVITELGVFNPTVLLDEIRREYHWLFD